MTIDTIIELLKLISPILSVLLVYLYRRQRTQANASRSVIESVIQVNNELRLELTRQGEQRTEDRKLIDRLEGTIQEQRLNHNLEMDRLTRLWAERNKDLEEQLEKAREARAMLRAMVFELEAKIRTFKNEQNTAPAS